MYNINSLRVILIIFLLGAWGCSAQYITNDLNLIPSAHFPRWLSTAKFHTEQTSGIAFIGKDSLGNKNFLLADDIGKIHLMKITDDTTFAFIDIKFSDSVINYFKDFPKLDFEEIVFDPWTKNVYLSVEGNGEEYRKFVHILRLIFKDNNIYSAYLQYVEDIKIEPEDEFLKFTKPNIGFEGIAVDSNNFYLGLENIYGTKSFGDSTLIYIVDKKNLTIKKTISTSGLGIQTICGLYSDNNNSLWGVDRNKRLIFHLTLNKNLDINQIRKTDFVPAIPGYTNIPYVSSAESICMDNENNIYIVDDPWYQFYIPPDSTLKQLDEETVTDFKEFIPVIYKFKKN